MKKEQKDNSFLIIRRGKKTGVVKPKILGSEKKTIEDMVKKKRVVKINRRPISKNPIDSNNSNSENAGGNARYSGQNAGGNPRYSGQNAGGNPRYSGQNTGENPRYSGQNTGENPRYSGQNAGENPRYSGQNAGGNPRYSGQNAGGNPRYSGQNAGGNPRYSGQNTGGNPRYSGQNTGGNPRYSGQNTGGNPRYSGQNTGGNPRYSGQNTGNYNRNFSSDSGFNPNFNRNKEGTYSGTGERNNTFVSRGNFDNTQKRSLTGSSSDQKKGFAPSQGRNFFSTNRTAGSNNNTFKPGGNTFNKRSNNTFRPAGSTGNFSSNNFNRGSNSQGFTKKLDEKSNPSLIYGKDRLKGDGFNKNKGKKDEKSSYYKSKNQEKEKFFHQKQKLKEIELTIPENIKISGPISVSDFAKKLCIKVNFLIKKLFDMGVIVTINDYLDEDTAVILGAEYNCKVDVVSIYDNVFFKEREIVKENLVKRPPIITVMGHVDHGKTKLLDVIREEDVVSKEYGGITQHIGASQIEVNTSHFKGEKIVFLDTPGHEAFSSMRMRGVKITDIVLLVVAADSGVMPQTIEAINHAKEGKVPIIVAINKIDSPNADIEKVKKQLSEIDILIEEWGGTVMMVQVSALKKININELLDTILLQAELLDLKGDPKQDAFGIVIESKIDVGKGTVISGILQGGVLKVGDHLVCGEYSGKVRAILDSRGQQLDIAEISLPIEFLGLNGVPKAGEIFYVVENEVIARDICEKRKEYNKIGKNKSIKRISLNNMSDHLSKNSLKVIKIILKADVHGSLDALKNALEKLSNDTAKIEIIHSAVGGVNENDVMLASISNAIILGFNINPNTKALEMAQKEKIDIHKYNIIYEMLDYVQGIIAGLIEKEKQEVIYGRAEVREIFKVLKIGVIAGSYVISGKILKSANIRVIRDNITVYTGAIESLKRFKKDINEVKSGFECGILIENYRDCKIGDILESFE